VQIKAERLRILFIYIYLSSTGFRQGWLIGNLGQEMADLNEVMRKHIDEIMKKWASMISAGLEQAQQQGQIEASLDCQELGSFALIAGRVILRMKIARRAQPLYGFIQFIFDVMLS
jgi:TetR/AcrR family transcriptional repressor of nem operon